MLAITKGGPRRMQTQTIPTLIVYLRQQQLPVTLEKLPMAYALGFRRQPSKLQLELRQRTVSQQARKMMSQREIHLAGRIPQSWELDSRSVSTPTLQLQHHLRPTKLPKIKKSLATRKAESRHTFCHADYRKAIVNMMERHYCAHPVIPGYAVPDPRAIKRWVVQKMYSFYTEHELPEVWAYLWENWYRKGRWEL